MKLGKTKKVIARGLEMSALACAVLAAFGMLFILIIIVTSVVMRKVIGSPLYFTDEVVGLLLSVSLFLGLPMVTLKSGHVRVSIIANALKGWKRKMVSILAAAIGIGFCGWLTYETIPWFEFAYRFNLKTETARVLLYPWMALLPITLCLTGIIFAAHLLGIIKNTNEMDPNT